MIRILAKILSEGKIGYTTLPTQWLRHSDGAIAVKVVNTLLPEQQVISTSLVVATETDVSLVISGIHLVINALHEMKLPRPEVLNMPYFPYARADRVFEDGNSNPLRVFCGQLIACGFNKIYSCDIHNVKAVEHWMGRRIVNAATPSCIWNTPTAQRVVQQQPVVVLPDEGAFERVSKYAKSPRFSGHVVCKKMRDIETGRILSVDVGDIPKHLLDKPFLIIDDICDGGGTFLPIAVKLREAGVKDIHLYVTHGIFSKGLQIFSGLINQIHCQNHIGTFVNATDILRFNSGELF